MMYTEDLEVNRIKRSLGVPCFCFCKTNKSIQVYRGMNCLSECKEDSGISYIWKLYLTNKRKKILVARALC